MRKPATIHNKSEQEGSEYLYASIHDSNDSFLEERSPPFLTKNSSQISDDSDCFSDSSRKIRKKRNTYHKISDEIRLELLNSVRDGETLKSAAKRFNINYSSAKSILHTYRKEGRILKKSAQERGFKTKDSTDSETKEESKPPKLTKKNSTKSKKTTQSLSSITEQTKCETMSNQCSEDNSPLGSVTGLNDNFMNLLTVGSQENQYEKESRFKIQNEAPFIGNVRKGSTKENEQVIGQPIDNYYGTGYRMTAQGATFKQQPFDNMFRKHSDHHFSEAEAPEVPSYINFSNEFDAFNDTPAWNIRKFSQSEDFCQDPNSFSNFKAFNSSYEDKPQKFDFGMDFEEYREDNSNCPLKSFMDTQNLFRQALRKASIVSYSGSASGLRKSSIDFFN